MQYSVYKNAIMVETGVFFPKDEVAIETFECKMFQKYATTNMDIINIIIEQ